MTDEIQAGLAKPIGYETAEAMLDEYLPKIQEHWEAAEALRNRIDNAKRTLAMIASGQLKGYGPETVADGEAQLAALEQELREHEWWCTVGLAMALAHGIPEILAKTADHYQWQPPADSVVRIILPGMLNLAVELKP